jgi:uncharacterized protein YlxP (DUF503 family)
VHVLALEVRFRVVESSSLKDKRRVVRSLLDQTRARFGVASAEVGDQDLHHTARLGFATVSESARHCTEVIDRVEGLVWSRPELEVLETERTWLG